MFTPKIQSVKKDNGIPVATITFTNGDEIVTELVAFTSKAELDTWVLAKQAQLIELDELMNNMVVGEEYVVEEVIIEEDPEPTPAEIMKEELDEMRPKVLTGEISEEVYEAKMEEYRLLTAE